MAHFVDRFGRKRVGLAKPSFTAGLTFGMVRGPLLAAAIQRHVTSGELLEWARREPFRGGRVFRLLAVGWPRWLSQPSVFIAMREQQALVTGAPLQRVFTEPRPGMLLSSPLTQNLEQRYFHIDVARAVLGNSLAALWVCLGCISSRWLFDRVGASRALLAGALGRLLAACAGGFGRTSTRFGNAAAGRTLSASLNQPLSTTSASDYPLVRRRQNTHPDDVQRSFDGCLGVR